jgi:putative flippase GtrA
MNLLFTAIKQNIRSISMFLVVGALSALINFSSFTLLWKVIGINYQVAVVASYILSVIFHFIANRRFSFKSHGADFSQHLFKYLLMISLNCGINFLIVRIVVEFAHLSPYIGLVLGIGVTMNISYILLRYWVFPLTPSGSSLHYRKSYD